MQNYEVAYKLALSCGHTFFLEKWDYLGHFQGSPAVTWQRKLAPFTIMAVSALGNISCAQVKLQDVADSSKTAAL